jgi:predicted nucleic acid-binding protein
MPASASAPDFLVDTSVAVALTVADHEHHETTFRALGDRRLGLAGHAAFETFSVLTRLPPPARRTPATVARLLAENFPAAGSSAPKRRRPCSRSFTRPGSPGRCLRALVGASAREHDLTLATRDRRALEIYRRLEVRVEFLP